MFKIKKIFIILSIIALILIVGIVSYHFGKLSSNGQVSKGQQKYHCPMHPTYIADKMGSCPICGMDLVPIENEKQETENKEQETENIEGHATIHINPSKQQLIGVTKDTVGYRDLKKIIRTAGKVELDETKISHVHMKFSGWIENVYVDYTFQYVRRGEPLLTIYSPELVSAQEEYLQAIKSGVLIEPAKRKLKFWDITDEQIKNLEENGTPNRTTTIFSPATGYIIHRDVFPNEYVEPNMELYSIADYSVVWVYANIYEYEIPMIKLGQKVIFSMLAYNEEKFEGKIVYILPQLDEMTRTLKVRIEFPNPQLKLKPHMYGNIEIEVPLGKKLSISENAILPSGNKQIAFVDKDNGHFEPRNIKTGMKVDDYYIVLDGAKAGEIVVTSANFLIDSESQLKSAISEMGK